MSDKPRLRSLAVVAKTESQKEPVVRLNEEQLRCLRLCASGISLRFESQEIVDALVAGGFVKEGVARVVTVTSKGLRYLHELG